MNYQLSINLLRYKVARVMNVGGVPCVVLPIEHNDLYAKMDERNQVSAVYLNCSVWETKEPSKYGDTHYVKQSHSKEYREAQSEESKRQEPIIGNMKPMESRSLSTAVVEQAPTITDPVDWNAIAQQQNIFGDI